jgi:hypothetical protein
MCILCPIPAALMASPSVGVRALSATPCSSAPQSSSKISQQEVGPPASERRLEWIMERLRPLVSEEPVSEAEGPSRSGTDENLCQQRVVVACYDRKASCTGPPATGETSVTLQALTDDSLPSRCGKASKRTIRTDTGRAGARTSVLTEAQAIEVFKLRPAARSDGASILSAELAERYSVTSTAIRHIWDRKTWVWSCMPHWTPEETADLLRDGVCDVCRGDGITRIEDTCGQCPMNRKRGRPRGSRDSYRRQRRRENGDDG